MKHDALLIKQNQTIVWKMKNYITIFFYNNRNINHIITINIFTQQFLT